MKAVIDCAHKLLRIIYKILATPRIRQRKSARTEAAVLTQKIKKSQLQYNTEGFLLF